METWPVYYKLEQMHGYQLQSCLKVITIFTD